ncbi:hypothetical protein C8Q77DRAFT_1158924 [Trametes polyzona]|nr:hypothetical protein C8Q77DRAFT_1158924 [Trametes polyzona]
MPSSPPEDGNDDRPINMYRSLKWTPERERAFQNRKRARLQARRPRARRNEEEEEKASAGARRAHRVRAGLSSPVDVWLATKLAQACSAEPRSPLSPDEVRCSVHVCRIPCPDPDDFFEDLDTFVLHLTVTSAPRSFQEGALESERRVVLGEYTGNPTDWGAPDWAMLPTDKAVVFVDDATVVANLIRRTGPVGDATATLADSLAAVRLDG